MSFSRSCRIGAPLAFVLLAGCEGTSGPFDLHPDVPCGAPFPAAPDGAGEIVYVAAQCLEAEANGTATHPYVRITDALAQAGDGATILVSAGQYKENLTLARPVTIVGSSNPASPDDAALQLEAEKDTAITVTAAGVTLIGVRIEGARGAGVAIDGGSATLWGSAVSGTQPGADGLQAAGVLVRGSGSLTLQSSAITGTAGTGVLVSEASASVTGSEVRDSLGFGMLVDRAVGDVTVSDSTVWGSTGAGIRVESSSVVIDASTIASTAPDGGSVADGDAAADGILSMEAQGADGSGLGASSVTVRGSVITGNGRTGVLCAGGTDTVILQGNTISDNGLPGSAVFEYMGGIWLQSGACGDPASEVSDNQITGNKLAGILLFGETHGVLVENNEVSGTLPEVSFGSVVGDGISLLGGASARLSGNVVSQSGRFGIMVETAPAAKTEISGNTLQNSAEYGIVLQGQAETIGVDGNTFSGNASGDVADVPAGTYGNPDRPLPF